MQEHLGVSFSVGSRCEEIIKNVAVSETHDRYTDNQYPDECTFELRTAEICQNAQHVIIVGYFFKLLILQLKRQRTCSLPLRRVHIAAVAVIKQ